MLHQDIDAVVTKIVKNGVVDRKPFIVLKVCRDTFKIVKNFFFDFIGRQAIKGR